MSDKKDTAGKPLRVPKTNPDDSTRLSDDEVKLLAEWFNTKKNDHPDGTGGVCEVCGTKKWYPLPTLFTEVIFDVDANMHLSTKVVPVFKVACSNCGNLKSFFASFLGITTKGVGNE